MFKRGILIILAQSVFLFAVNNLVKFFLLYSRFIMAVDPAVQDFIARSMAENNRSLMSEISTLITNSVESIKRSNSEAVVVG